MTGSQQGWNRELSEWVKKDSKNIEKLEQRISDKTLRDYMSGAISNLDNINPGTRAFLYKVTGIESIKPENYVDPESIRVREILSGDQPRSNLVIWLGYHDKTQQDLATTADVHRNGVATFIKGGRIKPSTQGKIIGALRNYAKEYEPVQTQSDVAKQTRILSDTPATGGEAEAIARALRPSVSRDLASVISRIEGDIGAIKISLAQEAGSMEAARLLNNQVYEPTPEERQQIVETAIDILVTQMTHYKNADQPTREALVKHLELTGELPRWGYLTNLLGGITKPGSSPDAFARTMNAPPKINSKGKK